MTGMYQHSIDSKGRLFIPARLREELGDHFYITLSMQNHCLWAFSLENWSKFNERISAQPISEQIRMRPLFSNAQTGDLDGQGRVLLNKSLREKRGLDKYVTVVGAGERVEIWDTEVFTAIDEQEAAPENIAAVFKELGI